MHTVSEQQLIDSAIAMMACLNEPWGIKDRQSRHLYMNEEARGYTNIPKCFALEGLLDSEFPAAWSELSNDFQQHDQKTVQQAKRVSVIETHYWHGQSSLSPYLSDKIPLFNQQGDCIATLWNARKIHFHSPLVYINQKAPSVLTTEQPSHPLLKKNDLDVIFLLMNNLTCKEMAKILHLSPRTVESRLQAIYQKVDVHSMHQLKEYCKQIGLDGYIPETLLVKGIRFI